jgi:anti-sigma regulatory factor (Ser/Thr protein kinase)
MRRQGGIRRITSRRGRSGSRNRSHQVYGARWQIAVIGLAGVGLELIIVHTALSGLARVDMAYDRVGRIATTERYFQDADQAHDALHADVLAAVLAAYGVGSSDDAARQVATDVRGFRQNLGRVTADGLSPQLIDALDRLKPVQERYVAASERVAHLAATNRAAALGALPVFDRLFEELEVRQGEATRQLGSWGRAVQTQAARDESTAKWRILWASLAAIVGLFGLTFLLSRLGKALTTMAARERGVAQTLQHSLLPDELPDLPGVVLGARYVTGGAGAQVGGDWYDVIPLPNGTVGLVMGDVAGHDLQAATVMGQLRNALRAFAVEGLPPGEVLTWLNRFCVSQVPHEMASCVYGVLDPVASTLTVANAGHYAPLAVDPEGGAHYLQQPTHPPIGALRETRYEDTVHHLQPNSTLAMFTDGLVERRGESVAVGLDRLAALVGQPVANLDQLCDDVLEHLLGDVPPADDVALLVVRPSSRLGDRLDLVWSADPTCLVDLRRTLERWLAEAGADESEIFEMVVACSEAATNAIEHAYGPGTATFGVTCEFSRVSRTVHLRVTDNGRWRPARGRDRGRGLHLIEGLMHHVQVRSSENGTTVEMSRSLGRRIDLTARRVATLPDEQHGQEVTA